MEYKNTKNERLLMDTWEFLVFSKFCGHMAVFAITRHVLVIIKGLLNSHICIHIIIIIY